MNLLKAALYDPTTAVNKVTTAALAMTAIDTTNLRLAITVPAHGMVRFRLMACLHGATTFPSILLGVMNGSTVVGRVAPVQSLGNTAVATALVNVEADFVATGLTPGAMNVDAAYGVETLVASTGLKYGGPNNTTANDAFGAFVFEAWDPQPMTANSTLLVDANGRVDVIKIAGTTQTARDIGASVLLSTGTGAGQLDFTSGVVKANLAQILGTALTETAGLLAGGFKKFFNIASPTATLNSLPDAVPGAAGGLLVDDVWTDARAAKLDNLSGDAFARLGAPVGASISADVAGVQSDTDNIQTRLPAALVSGRMDSNVGAMAANVLTATAINADAITDAKVASDVTIASVTGSVGSVTGAVGSVTGNVGGNVTGSVGSISGITFPSNFSSLVIDATGRVNAFLIGILTTAFTEGAAGRIAAAFKQFFNIASPAATMDHGVLVDTVTTYTGNTPQTGDSYPKVDTEVATLVTGVADIQSRIPTALGANGNIKADLRDMGGVAQSATDLKDFADTGYDPATHKVTGVVLADTVTTYTGDTPQTGDSYAKVNDGTIGLAAIKGYVDDIGVAGAGLTALGDTRIANLDATISSRTKPADTQAAVTLVTTTTNLTTNNDKTGYGLSAAAVQAIWDALTSALTTSGSIGKWILDKLDVVLSTRLATSGYTVPPTVTAIRTEMDSNSTKLANLDATVSSRLASAGYTAPDNADIVLIKAKTDNLPALPAAVGSAMTLTSGERTSIANEVEAQIIDETDSEKVLTAITDKIAAVNPDLSGLTVSAIASGVRTNLATELGRIDVAVSTRGTGTGTALDAAGVRAAVGLGSANLDTQLDALPTNAELATALGTADDAVLAAIAALNNLSQADIRTAIGIAAANLDAQLNALPTNSELATALAGADDAVLAAVAALNDLSSAQIQTAAAAALDAYDGPTRAEATSDKDAVIAEIDANEVKIDAVKAQTDQLAFTVANQVDVNIQSVNEVAVTGSGTVGDEWGPV